MTVPTGAVVLVDPSGTAHAPNALTGLARAADARGLHVVVHAPHRLDAPGDWVEAASATVLTTRALRRVHRAAIRAAIEGAPPGSVVVDLDAGRTVDTRGRRVPSGPGVVHVVHQTNAFDGLGPSTTARAAAGNRCELVRLAGAGGAFVAHTTVTATCLADLVPDAPVAVTGWPVISRDDPWFARAAARPRPAGTRRLLFAGSVRVAKGLALLVDAVRDLPEAEHVDVPGVVPEGIRRKLGPVDDRIEWWNRWLPADEYTATLRGADLLVLPYGAAYLRRGTSSSVLAEALAAGRPVVVSSALAGLLPPGYEGAVVAADETAAGLRDAIRTALATLPALTEAAGTAGRDFARTRHTYEGYLDAVLTLARR